MKRLKCILGCMFFSSVICADTMMVTTLADNGEGSLRDALLKASDNSFIEFDENLFGSIVLESPLPVISVNYLKIIGPISNQILIEGSDSYRIFDVQGKSCEISHLDLSHGADLGQGGAVYVQETSFLTLSNSTIIPATGLAGTNSCFVEQDAGLELNDVVFSSDEVSQIYLNEGSLSLSSSFSSHFVIDGTEGSQVSKSGQGTLTIATPSFDSSDYYLTIVEAEVEFAGTLTSPVSILSNGSLRGSFAASDVANLGILQPGDVSTLGNVELSGIYSVSSGTTEIKLDPSGNCDVITVGKDVFLVDAILRIVPNSGSYIAGTKYRFLVASGGINGVFSSVSIVSPIDVQINYGKRFVEVEILNTTHL